MKFNKYIVLVIVFFALVILLAIGLSLDPREVPSPLINKAAPDFSLPVLESQNPKELLQSNTNSKDNAEKVVNNLNNISPRDLKGKFWLLNVWATWCISCRAEHTLLVDFANKNPDVTIIGLNYKEVRGDSYIDSSKMSEETERSLADSRAKKWLVERGNPYDWVAMDLNGRIGIDYGVYGVPETYLIDKEGIIRMKHTGPLTPEIINSKILPTIKSLGM